MRYIVLLLLSLSLMTPALAQDNASQWEENLDTLVAELPQRHTDPFHNISEADFLAEAERLRSDLPTLNDDEALIRMAALVALIGDSHTTLYWDMRDPLFPMSLLPLEDGIYPIAVYPDAADVLGARLVEINGQPIEEVIAQIAMIIPHENEAWLNAQLPNFLIRSEVMIGLGIIETSEFIPWTFETQAGETVTMELTAQAPEHLNVGGMQTARPLDQFPRTESNNGYYWLELFDDGTLYLKYNTAADAPDLPFSRVMEIILTALVEQPVERLVIDLRSNTGGNSAILDPLITALKDNPINTPGKLFVIIGSRTYSSALLNAFRLSQETEAVLIGQPTGGAPNHFGEVRTFDLPHFDLTVSYSTNYFEMLPGVEANTLEPDILVEWTLDDYLAGIDPFYAAVLAYEE